MSEQLQPTEAQPTPEQLLHASREFLQHFGVEVDPIEQPEQFLGVVAQMDPRKKEGGKEERYLLEDDSTQWPEDAVATIMRTAESMGMLRAETPLVGEYDVVIVLGGARQSNLDRSRYAAESLREGRASARHLVVAGSSRRLKEAEQANASNYAPGATTEFDLCAGAAATVARENPGIPVSVQLIDEERVGAPTIINAVLSSLQVGKGAKVAAVTTQIYQPFTSLDLARAASEFGATETFTAGNPSDSNVVARRTPATYLSEILRTLKAATHAFQAEQERRPYAEREKTATAVDAAILPTDTILESNEGGRSLVLAEDGSRYVIEPDGTRWVREIPGGIIYDGPDDHIGAQYE
jgi:hypothetical protein